MKSSERKLEYNRLRYKQKKAQILAAQKQYYQANKDKISDRNAAYRERRGDPTASLRASRYEERHRARRNEEKRMWRAANPGAAYAAYVRYVKRNPQVKRHWDATRRARLAGAFGGHSLSEWEQKKEAFGNRCGYCGATGKIVRDHDQPLSRGGSHNIGNIVPSCVRCNSQKRALTGDEYRKQFHANATR